MPPNQLETFAAKTTRQSSSLLPSIHSAWQPWVHGEVGVVTTRRCMMHSHYGLLHMHHMLVIGSYVGEPCPNISFRPKNTVSLVTVYCEIVYSIVTMNTVHTHTHTPTWAVVHRGTHQEHGRLDWCQTNNWNRVTWKVAENKPSSWHSTTLPRRASSPSAAALSSVLNETCRHNAREEKLQLARGHMYNLTHILQSMILQCIKRLL